MANIQNKRTWSQSVTRSTIRRPSHCPASQKRATPKAPRMCKYINTLSWQRMRNATEPMRAVYNTPMRRSLLLCSWLTNEFAKFTNRQNKSVRYAFYYVYVYPTSAHRGFRYGYRRNKGNNFTLKTLLFGWQNVILRFDLTLYKYKYVK